MEKTVWLGALARHVDGLQALVVTECAVDSRESAAVAADKAGRLAVHLIGGRGRVIDAIGRIHGREHAARRIRSVRDRCTAGVSDFGD